MCLVENRASTLYTILSAPPPPPVWLGQEGVGPIGAPGIGTQRVAETSSPCRMCSKVLEENPKIWK